MTLRNSMQVGLVVVAAVAAAACSRDEPVQETRTTAEQAATTAGDAASDARISTAVQAKYYSDDGIRGRRIDVETQNGNVTLRGTVPDEAAKQQAVALARGVEGVKNVNDELQVRADTVATTPSDPAAREVGTAGRDDERQPGWITTKIQAQYFIDPEISPWAIDVTTGAGGVVTLEGSVDSEQDKTQAVRIARDTEGVTRVEDKLRVVPEGDRDRATPANIDAPDAWLTAKIQSKYFIDTDVKGRRIDVDTRNGVVTLTGTVGSETARRQAVALARNTDGVRDVQDQLKVDATGDRDTTSTAQKDTTTATVERPDVWLTTKIQSQYFLDPDVKGHQINVDTKNGVVTLKGFVDNAAQKTEAEQIARETEGVRRVVNELKIGAGSGG